MKAVFEARFQKLSLISNFMTMPGYKKLSLKPDFWMLSLMYKAVFNARFENWAVFIVQHLKAVFKARYKSCLCVLKQLQMYLKAFEMIPNMSTWFWLLWIQSWFEDLVNILGPIQKQMSEKLAWRNSRNYSNSFHCNAAIHI